MSINLGNDKIFCFDDPKSHVAEVFRTLRTNIKYMGVQRLIKTILISSAQPGEGKTTLVAELGVALAQDGHKVLIIDCDLRKPSLHRRFDLPNEIGLTKVLIHESSINDAIVDTKQSNLNVLPSGPLPPNPSELLGSTNMQQLLHELAKEYEFVLLDSSPIIPVSDAQVVGKLVDGAILVVYIGKTLQSDVKKAQQLLNHVNVNLIGTVLNRKKISIQPYY